MPYTGSKAQSGSGTQLSIGSGTGTITYTPVYEVIDINPSGELWDTDETTNLNSVQKEFLNTVRDPGTFEITMNRVATDAGQVAVEAAYSTGALTPFKVQLGLAIGQTTTGDVYTFVALVQKFVPGPYTSNKKVSISCTLKLSGQITKVLGS